MNEGLPPIEQGNERIPTREDILAQIRTRCEGAAVIRELSDTEGVYLLETRKQGEKPGESTEYTYQRKGVFPNKIESAATVLQVFYCADDVPLSGEIIAEYDTATGEWIEC